MTRLRSTAVAGLFGLIAVAAATAASFPDVIPLPNGWRPEGIESGRAHTLYVGSIPTGAIRQVDARTGDQFTLVQPMTGRSAIGIEYDRRNERLFVAGGGTGEAYVYDAETGAPIAAYTLTPTMPTFINDLVLTDDPSTSPSRGGPGSTDCRSAGAASCRRRASWRRSRSRATTSREPATT